MRLATSLFLFTLLLVPAFGANKTRKTNSVPPSGSTQGRHTDKGRGFSIALPSGWQKDKDQMGTAVMALSNKENANDFFRENINVVVETLTGSMSTKEYFEASQGAIKKVFQDFKLEKTGKEKLNNKEFMWSVYTHKTPTSKAKVLQYVAVNGLRAYIITCSAAPENFDRYRTLFTSSIKSFKFE